MFPVQRFTFRQGHQTFPFTERLRPTINSKKQSLAWPSRLGRSNDLLVTPHHWLFQLPQLHPPGWFQDAILSPLEAISCAFEAIKTNDTSLRKKAFEGYAKGLAEQKHQLQLLMQGRLQSKDYILWPLLMALALLEFEMMAPSSLHSWSRHSYGSLNLLIMLGPAACQKAPFFDLFWQLRFTMASSSGPYIWDPCR